MDFAAVKSWIASNADLLSGLDGLLAVIGIVGSMLVLPLRHRLHASRPAIPASAAPVPGPAPAAAAPSLPNPAGLTGPGAVAVMPFDCLSCDVNDTHLADGLSCEIISALARAGHRHLAPRADSFALRGRSLALAEIAKELSVRYVVQGSVRHDADTLRVIAEFSDSVSGRLLWSKTYDRPFSEILKVQSEIAQSIAASLGGETFRAEVLHLAPSTNDTTAWSLAQKARHRYMLSTGPAAINEAIGFARKALALDPNYGLAHALLAQLLMDLVSTASAPEPAQARSEARAAIEHALSTSGRDPEVLMYAGRVWVELGEREKSIAALRRATQAAPSDLMGWGFLARSLAFGSTAEAEEAHKIAERIIGIAPEHPCVWTWELFEGLACMNLGRHEDALAAFRQVVQAAPKFVRGLMCCASALGACGRVDEAREMVERSLAINANLTPQRFAGYVQTLSIDPATTRRLTCGLQQAGLLGQETSSGADGDPPGAA